MHGMLDATLTTSWKLVKLYSCAGVEREQQLLASLRVAASSLTAPGRSVWEKAWGC